METATIPRVRGLPLVGNLLDLRADRTRLLLRVSREFGDIARLQIGFMPVVSIAAPELVHEVLVEKNDAFMKAPGLSIFARPLLGNGLLTSERDFHKKQRRMMAPVFMHKRIAGFADVMSERAQRAVSRWESGSTI